MFLLHSSLLVRAPLTSVAPTPVKVCSDYQAPGVSFSVSARTGERLRKEMEGVIPPRTINSVKEMIGSACSTATVEDKMSFYDSWAENYDQDVALVDYHAATIAAKTVSSHYTGDRGAAVVLDVACGTGLVAKQMKEYDFGNFVGIDGSKVMLEQAKKKGLYQDLKLCFLGEQRLPAEKGSFDVVVICGSLCVGHVPVHVVKELWSACKPGGYVCMTCRHGEDNQEFRAALEGTQKQMEEEGLWSCVNISVVEKWSKAVMESEDGFISGSVYLYKKV